MSSQNEMNPLTRRQLFSGSTLLATGALLAESLPALADEARVVRFADRWKNDLDRVWLGAEVWAGPMQDWRIRAGRLECIRALPGRNVQVLTVQHNGTPGTFSMKVRIGRLDGTALGAGQGSAGFRIGILGTLGDDPALRDYRNNLAFSGGLDAGFTTQGGLFFGDVRKAAPGKMNLSKVQELLLELISTQGGSPAEATLSLRAMDVATQQILGETTLTVPQAKLTGNLALAANFGPPMGPGGKPDKSSKLENGMAGPGLGTFWFSDWSIEGSSLTQDDSQTFGPILFNHYSLSGGILKMTAQLPPLGEKDNQTAGLEVQRDGAWRLLAEEVIHPQARTAAFRIGGWDASRDHAYRLGYQQKFADGSTRQHYYEGTVRRDPVDQEVLSVADISCNIHTAFPNTPYVKNVARLNPDLLAFVGDQFYENTAGFGIVNGPLEVSSLDYLRKWYFHGWTWRSLTRDRPSLCLPDDHDVYQGNIWGEGGAPQGPTQESGGYLMEAEWVNVVHRTQTSHHPDAWDGQPCRQGILNYYGPMTYGRVSFAVLADRQFKSGPQGKVPPTGGRGDHVTDPGYNIKSADQPGLELLGEKQLSFLKAWAEDWRGSDMKAVISQTIFTGMATTHGQPKGELRADFDANGWPQAARHAALREIRKAFAFHMAGDQHLPAVVHYGIDSHRDAGVAFAGPAVNVGYPRWWHPTARGNGRDQRDGLLGDFNDSFGHPLSVLAVRNGATQPRRPTMDFLADKASGFGMVRFNKKNRTITIECWPFGTAFGTAGAAQMPTWPVVIQQSDNYARSSAAWLPELIFEAGPLPVVQVVEEASGEVLYTLRAPSSPFNPHTFAEGKHTLRISDPDRGRSQVLSGVAARAGSNGDQLKVTLSASSG